MLGAMMCSFEDNNLLCMESLSSSFDGYILDTHYTPMDNHLLFPLPQLPAKPTVAIKNITVRKNELADITHCIRAAGFVINPKTYELSGLTDTFFHVSWFISSLLEHTPDSIATWSIKTPSSPGRHCNIVLYNGDKHKKFVVRQIPRYAQCIVDVTASQQFMCSGDIDCLFSTKLNYLITNRITPHIPIVVATYAHCRMIMDYKCLPLDKTKYIDSHMVICEQAEGTLQSLFESLIITKRKVSITQLISILFQVIYTLYSIRLYFPGFVHGDLHLANILMRPVAVTTNTYYTIGSVIYKIPIDYNTLLTDFGYSYSDVIRQGQPHLPHLNTHYADSVIFLNSLWTFTHTAAYHKLLTGNKETIELFYDFCNFALPVEMRYPQVIPTHCKKKSVLLDQECGRLLFNYNCITRTWTSELSPKTYTNIAHKTLQDFLEHDIFKSFQVASVPLTSDNIWKAEVEQQSFINN